MLVTLENTQEGLIYAQVNDQFLTQYEYILGPCFCVQRNCIRSRGRLHPFQAQFKIILLEILPNNLVGMNL